MVGEHSARLPKWTSRTIPTASSEYRMTIEVGGFLLPKIDSKIDKVYFSVNNRYNSLQRYL